ncbi:MAG: ribonuclease PH [Rhodobacteraceae bacterium]|nr:ribonuclease PH [Paracoccaceae bacterium]
MRLSKRKFDELRPVSIEIDVNRYAEGSCLISCGHTKVLCTASVEEHVPFFRRRTGLGWISAEYSLLPRATHERNRRDGRGSSVSGRTLEIQRLIGRSLRAGVNFASLGERQIMIDCDVLQADGGTRCASITGGWVALRLAVNKLLQDRYIVRDPLQQQVIAISCGIHAGSHILDLDYNEDSNAEVDGNFVFTSSGELIEVQCTAEDKSFPTASILEFIELSSKGANELVRIQNEALAKKNA